MIKDGLKRMMESKKKKKDDDVPHKRHKKVKAKFSSHFHREE